MNFLEEFLLFWLKNDILHSYGKCQNDFETKVKLYYLTSSLELSFVDKVFVWLYRYVFVIEITSPMLYSASASAPNRATFTAGEVGSTFRDTNFIVSSPARL